MWDTAGSPAPREGKVAHRAALYHLTLQVPPSRSLLGCIRAAEAWQSISNSPLLGLHLPFGLACRKGWRSWHCLPRVCVTYWVMLQWAETVVVWMPGNGKWRLCPWTTLAREAASPFPRGAGLRSLGCQGLRPAGQLPGCHSQVSSAEKILFLLCPLLWSDEWTQSRGVWR